MALDLASVALRLAASQLGVCVVNIIAARCSRQGKHAGEFPRANRAAPVGLIRLGRPAKQRETMTQLCRILTTCALYIPPLIYAMLCIVDGGKTARREDKVSGSAGADTSRDASLGALVLFLLLPFYFKAQIRALPAVRLQGDDLNDVGEDVKSLGCLYLFGDAPVVADRRGLNSGRVLDQNRTVLAEYVASDLDACDAAAFPGDLNAPASVLEKFGIFDADVDDLLLRPIGLKIDAGTGPRPLRIHKHRVIHRYALGNTKVVDLVKTLRDFVAEVVIYDPMADAALAKHEYGLTLTNDLPEGPFDAVILAVKHAPIAQIGEAGIKALLAPGGLIYDLKGILPPSVSHARI